MIDQAVLQEFDTVMEQADADLRAEMRTRLDRGELPFLPSQLRFKRGRIRFPYGIGWMDAPDFDPGIVSGREIELVSLVQAAGGFLVDVVAKADRIAPDHPFTRDAALARILELEPMPAGAVVH